MSKQPENNNFDLQQIEENENNSSLDELLNQKTNKREEANTPHVVVGKLSAINEDGYPVVIFTINDSTHTVITVSTVTIKIEDVGRDCLVSFNEGDIDQPIITGLIQPPITFDEDKPTVIHSDTGIILKCGASRIELTEDGTINIQGMHINSQAYGPHRIKGGSVKIN